MIERTNERRKILVTSALPYANGPIHLGHLVEYIQTDIWKRFQKIRGHECYYVCADDAHGTAIMLKAEELNISAEKLIGQVNSEHKQDFQGFLINFDNYHTTHSKENQELSNHIYNRLNDNGHIAVRQITQAFDPEKNLFLSDRYIKGTCPKCKAADQYGDNCEACGATYSPLDLINPVSTITGVPPIAKESTHYFFKVSIFVMTLQMCFLILICPFFANSEPPVLWGTKVHGRPLITVLFTFSLSKTFNLSLSWSIYN